MAGAFFPRSARGINSVSNFSPDNRNDLSPAYTRSNYSQKNNHKSGDCENKNKMHFSLPLYMYAAYAHC